MKFSLTCLILGAILLPRVFAEEKADAEIITKHREGAVIVADQQDELAADVQQFTIEQTVPQVIDLFREVEKLMDEATDRLAEHETGGETLATQTEVIEKIYEAAQKQQQSSGSGKGGSAMMEMMERMMGKGQGKEKGQGQANQQGNQGTSGGQGQGGTGVEANVPVSGSGDGKQEERKVPKATGQAGAVLPEEFQSALDAYNRGLEQKNR